MRRLNAAYFQAVSAERAFEKHRGDVVAAYTADGTAITTAERHARIDPECQRLETRLIDARANIARLEAFAVHWRFLIEHAPGH